MRLSSNHQGMVRHARPLGATDIVGMRYYATELMAVLTEVLCYGTAVSVQRAGD